MTSSRSDPFADCRECTDCGLLQRLPPLPDGEAALCSRCDAMLRRADLRSIPLARVCAPIALILLCFAFDLPFLGLATLGRFSRSTLLSGPRELGEHGLGALGIAVILTLLVWPLVKLLVELAVLFRVRGKRVPAWLSWLFGCLDRISPWAMVEVFILGAFVAYTRLRPLAHVEIGPAIFALGGVMLCMVAVDATLDREAIWQELDAKRIGGSRAPSRSRSQDPSAPLGPHGCHVCGKVSLTRRGDHCPRCGHALRHRDTRTLGHVWALLLTALLLYLPANLLPVMTVERLGKGGPTTIGNGVVELAQARLWPIAILVLVASILVPIGKLVSMVAMLVMTHRGSRAGLKMRTRLFRVVRAVGRWSMIDIFMLATLVGVVRLGFLATVLPGTGALAFCAVVVITMVATELFDPRLMWDAAGLAGLPTEGGERHG